MRDLAERAPSRLRRLLDHGLADDQAGADRSDSRGSRAEPETPVARPAERVAEEERDRTEREMHLPGERNRRECSTGECEPPPTASPRPPEGPERKREENRDRAEEVADALLHPVGRDREGEAARQRGAAWQTELAEPGARRETCQPVEQDLQEVPAADQAEHRGERPEED